MRQPSVGGERGFTLIELLVVVLIIGILAAIAVPQYFKTIEHGRFAEVPGCVDVIKGAQERYYLKFGGFAATTTSLDSNCTLKYFNSSGSAPCSGPVVGGNCDVTLALYGGCPGGAGGYTAAFNRANPAPQGYGNYTVTFTHCEGNNPPDAWTCSNSGTCAAVQTDLLPQ